MARSKKSTESSTKLRRGDVTRLGRLPTGSLDLSLGIHLPERSCKDHFEIVEPGINAEGVHTWPFDPSCPIDVLFLTVDDRHRVRMNRHSYFEVLYLCSGSANCHIQDRLLPFNEGDLAIIGSTLYHRIECQSSSPLTLAAMFFDPDIIRCDGASDSTEYLTPFLLQDTDFPHIVPAETGVPRQVLDMMLRVRSEQPASSPRSRLALKTYLKMLLMHLVNQYAQYAGTVETFQRQQQALDRLRPLFRYLGENCGNCIQVGQAARICGMSESHFMSVFKRVTGLSFVTYINHYRIERAQVLLATTDRSIADISQRVGFCDQSYFGTIFRRTVGMTPVTYRRLVRAHNFSEQAQLDHMPPISLGGLSVPAIPKRNLAEKNGIQLTGRNPDLIAKRNGTWDRVATPAKTDWR
ncbi:MAG: AraC family transcriptional regulator [Terracidiphilus sp.]|jgi:AraC-like DNA-binding protein/mannose-6-phosphate isomerase-like protein (cupin superfamily)